MNILQLKASTGILQKKTRADTTKKARTHTHTQVVKYLYSFFITKKVMFSLFVALSRRLASD